LGGGEKERKGKGDPGRESTSPRDPREEKKKKKKKKKKKLGGDGHREEAPSFSERARRGKGGISIFKGKERGVT